MEDKAAYGWVVYPLPVDFLVEPFSWQTVASKSCLLPNGVSIMYAELEVASSVISVLHAYVQSYERDFTNIQNFPAWIA